MKADAKRLRRIMGRAHVTVHDVAKAADLPPQTTAAIICGMNVQPDTLGQIARALGVRLDDIALGVAPTSAIPHQPGGGCSSGQELQKLPVGQVEIDTERFAAAMARSGLTVKQLAERAGVSPGTVRSIGRGAAAHKTATVDKLADALGVAAYHIIKKEGST